MKSCPTCHRTYPDDTLAFCLMDGSVLSAPYDPAETRRVPAAQSSPPPTEMISARTMSAEPRSPMRSTIQAALPQIPTMKAKALPTQPAAKSASRTSIVRMLFGLRGLAAILFGVSLWSGLPPGFLWADLFSAYVLLSGICMILCAIKGQLNRTSKGLVLLDGIIGVLGGAVLFVLVQIHAVFFPWMPVWAILTGALMIGVAISLRKYISRGWLLGLAGAISIWFGYTWFARNVLEFFVLEFFLYRFFGYRFFGPLGRVGTYAVLYGLLLTVFALVARSKNVEDL